MANRPPDHIDHDLKIAAQGGLIVTLSDPDTDLSQKLYAFAHDRIQQASYALIPLEQKAKKHAQIGHVLLRHFSNLMRNEKIFLVVNHLNLGVTEVSTRSDQIELAQLNLMAGKRAKQSTAYDMAIAYFTIALNLLGDHAWEQYYPAALTTHQEIAASYYVRGKFEAMELYLDTLLRKSSVFLDKIAAYELQIQSYLARSYFDKAVQTSIYVVRLLGVKISSEINSLEMGIVSLKMQYLFKNKRPLSLAHLPIMNNPKIEAAIRILASANSAAYMGLPLFLPLILSKQS